MNKNATMIALMNGVSALAISGHADASCSTTFSNTSMGSIVTGSTLTGLLHMAVSNAVGSLSTSGSLGCEGQSYTIYFNGGTYDFSSDETSSQGPIALTGSGYNLEIGDDPSNQTELYFAGSIGRNPTVIVSNASSVTGSLATISGTADAMHNVSHVVFKNLTFQAEQNSNDASNCVSYSAPCSGSYELSATTGTITYSATQGTVVGVSTVPGNGGSLWLTLSIQSGFPSPAALLNNRNWEGRYIRFADNTTPSIPLLLDEWGATESSIGTDMTVNNSQVSWGQVQEGQTSDPTEWIGPDGTTYTICNTSNLACPQFPPTWPTAPYVVHDSAQNGSLHYDIVEPFQPDVTNHPSYWTLYVPASPGNIPSNWPNTIPWSGSGSDIIACVKSKPGWMAPYQFDGGGSAGGAHDITFKNVTWQTSTRGDFTNGAFGIHIIDSQIVRNPAPNGGTQAPCLSSSAGGPQIGQPNSTTYPTSSNYVSGFSATATGDDSLAFFNDNSMLSIPGTLCGPTSGRSSAVVCESNVQSSTIASSFARSILLQNGTSNDGTYNASNVLVSYPDTTSVIGGTYTVYTQSSGLGSLANSIVTGNARFVGGNPDYCDNFTNQYNGYEGSSLLYPWSNTGSTAIPTPLCGIYYLHP
jgi:hypothetical protein